MPWIWGRVGRRGREPEGGPASIAWPTFHETWAEGTHPRSGAGLAFRPVASYAGPGVWMRQQHTTTWMNLETVAVPRAEA